MGWWWVEFAMNSKALTEPAFWVIPLVLFLYAASAPIWLQGVSEVRRFWRKGARVWLWLVLPVEAGILLALVAALSRPRPLVLNVSEALFLLAMGVSFPYLVSRQRRTEGATQ
jgi:hypothetical protein